MNTTTSDRMTRATEMLRYLEPHTRDENVRYIPTDDAPGWVMEAWYVVTNDDWSTNKAHSILSALTELDGEIEVGGFEDVRSSDLAAWLPGNQEYVNEAMNDFGLIATIDEILTAGQYVALETIAQSLIHSLES